MFTRFKSSGVTLFLDPATKIREYDRSEKVNIILSPSLYWVQKLSLPVKYIREVKKLLPSIFEEFLPKGDYSYTAYKNDDDDFFVFAYEDKKILELLHQNEINISDIRSIHFAQSEFTDLDKAVMINETRSLYLKDEILGLAPTTWFQEFQELDIEGIELSKHTIKLQQYGHLVKSSSLYKIAGLLVALILIIFVESFIASQKIDTIIESKDKLFSKYKLQSTRLQNKSLQSKYKKIYNKQTKLRKNISYFLTMKLKSTQKITLLTYKNNILYVNVAGVENSEVQMITNVLNAKKLKFTHTFNNGLLKVETKI